MLKALCFLGTGPQGGKYSKTSYVKHDDNTQCYRTDLFPEAVNQLYCPNKIIVFVTPQVKEGEYLCRLRKNLGAKLKRVELLDILDRGNSEADMWKIFDVYQQSVDEGDEIILDITHGFRSLPMLAFPVVAYLRQVKQVELKHILYAPFDTRLESTGKNTPIFDLTPFVNLLDWMNAVNVFQRTGDARPIADLEGVNTIRNKLTTLSNALLTNRTLEAQEAVGGVVSGLTHPKSLEQLPSPFHILIDQVKDTYAGISVLNPKINPKESLTGQYVQIKWYIDNLHYLHAITLIREWLVSWELLQIYRTSPNLLDDTQRDKAENALNGRFAAKSKLPLDKLWSACADTRNDLAHCGMRTNARRSKRAIAAIENLFKDFEFFFTDLVKIGNLPPPK